MRDAFSRDFIRAMCSSKSSTLLLFDAGKTAEPAFILLLLFAPNGAAATIFAAMGAAMTEAERRSGDALARAIPGAAEEARLISLRASED